MRTTSELETILVEFLRRLAKQYEQDMRRLEGLVLELQKQVEGLEEQVKSLEKCVRSWRE